MMRKILLSHTIFCCALQTSVSVTWADTMQTLQYDRAQVQLLPQGCSSAFLETNLFVEFFASATQMLVATRGAGALGAVDLFATLRLREHYREHTTNSSQESPIDRLIVAQVCRFRELRLEQLDSASKQRLVVESSDEQLLDHLAAIAPKLLSDSLDLVQAAISEEQEKQRSLSFLRSREKEIQKARREGRKKAEGLLKAQGR